MKVGELIFLADHFDYVEVEFNKTIDFRDAKVLPLEILEKEVISFGPYIEDPYDPNSKITLLIEVKDE